MIFLPFAGSTKHGTNYAFSWPLIRNQLTSLVKPSKYVAEFKNKTIWKYWLWLWYMIYRK